MYDSSCPYQTLQIPVGSDYETTRRAFLHMVKIHHPDNGGKTHDFIRIRSAFEAIADGKPFVGKTNHHHHHGHHETHHNDDDGEFYYHHHHDEENGTHHRTTTTTVEDFLELELTEQTRQEIIQVYRRNWSNHSGVHYMHDKGGLWEMARQLSERDARGIDPPIPSKIEAGNATLGRRKRRLR
jgi:DnaJ-class molecular chaperone